MTDSVLADQTSFPETLCEREQWVCWKQTQRDGKATKIPVTPGGGGFASSTDPETWTGFEIALEYAQTGNADGVGFVFTDDDPIVGVDLDVWWLVDNTLARRIDGRWYVENCVRSFRAAPLRLDDRRHVYRAQFILTSYGS